MFLMEDLESLLARGAQLLRAGEPRAALQILATIREPNANDPRALALLALAHFRQGDLSKARPVYEALIALEPGDISHHFNLGLVCLKLGDVNIAIHELELAQRDDAFAARATSNLGLAYTYAERYADAYRMFLRAGQAALAREVASQLTDGVRLEIERESGGGAAPQVEASPTTSMQFVANPAPSVSAAVKQATPSSTATSVVQSDITPAAERVSALAQRLAIGALRAADSQVQRELTIDVRGGFYVRHKEVDVWVGEQTTSTVAKRHRGQGEAEPFDDKRPLALVQGSGMLAVLPRRAHFVSVRMEDHPIYLCSDLLFGFSPTLTWENGAVPGTNHNVPLVQLRGEGDFVLRLHGALRCLSTSPLVDTITSSRVLVGWLGNLTPRAEAEGNAWAIRFRGDGMLLLSTPESP